MPRVDLIEELLERNRGFAASAAGEPGTARPRRGLAIVACMDARLDPLAALGLSPGEAHVLRNAGGAVTEDMIRSLAISQRKLGTRAVMLIHHTDCGMETIEETAFRAELEEAAGTAPSFAIEAFEDVEEAVRESILRVRRSPFLPHRDDVRGFVYDVATGLLREVEA